MLCPRTLRRSLPQRHTLLARCPPLPLPLCCNNRCSCRLPGAPQLRHLCRRSLQALPRRSPTPTRTPFWTGQWVCCAPRPTNWPSPRRQAPLRSSNRCAFSPSPPNCTPSRTWRSQGGIDSSSDHSSRYTPVSEGTKAWVVDSFIEGQPMSSRRSGMKRRAALMFDLTGDPPPKRDPSSSSSGTSFKPTARRPFAYLPDHRLDFDEEDDE